MRVSRSQNKKDFYRTRLRELRDCLKIRAREGALTF